MKLLITEKDMLVQKWFHDQAEALDVDVIFADSRSEAFEIACQELPDCIVLDASSSMGEEQPLWSSLRHEPLTQHIPVLMYSSSWRWQGIAESAGAVVDGCLPRPFTASGLLSTVQGIIQT